MTQPIVVEFDGDCWNNPTQFQQQLDQHPRDEPLLLDFRSEGPSLAALGITGVINDWLRLRKKSPNTVHLKKWSNPVEFVPYQRIECNKISHFFFMARDYWQHTEPTLEQQLQRHQLFGLFIGRVTTGRAAILYSLMTDIKRRNIFASRMNHTQRLPWHVPDEEIRNLENISEWMPLHKQTALFDWFNGDNISSVDSKFVRDQFVTPTSYIGTNASLLQHYHNFAVEIVCETYTLGNTFFPTEKTIRPLMAAKPILVYGPQYYLARLRTLGFRTYNEIWDESYDLYQGPKRWDLMQQTINQLIECGHNEQRQILTQAHKIAMHNRRHLENICNHSIDLYFHDYIFDKKDIFL